MNKRKIALIGVIAALLLSGCARVQDGQSGGANDVGLSAPSDVIGAKEAEKAALDHAGIAADEATVIKTEYDHDDNEYDVEFTAGDYKYEYDIGAADGSVIEFSKKIIGMSDTTPNVSGTTSPDTSASPAKTDDPGQSDRTSQPAQTTLPAPSTQLPASESGGITLEEAKAAALDNEGLTESGVTFIKAFTDNNSTRSIYEFKFVTADYEYEYKIDANSGTVLSNSKEVRVKQTAGSAAGRITLEEAKDKALSHAGISEAEASFTKTKLDNDDGREEYEIEFVAADYKYEYEIDAESGMVLSSSRKTLSGRTTSVSAGSITLEEAKAAALEHAGLTASDVTFTKTKLDNDDGREEYDIEFVSDDYEYEYEIDSQSGAVLSNSKEARKGQTMSAAEGWLTLEDAKNAALDHAGVSASDADFTKTKLDYDDGRGEYDIKFYVGGWKYEYTIDAATGEIIEYEIDD